MIVVRNTRKCSQISRRRQHLNTARSSIPLLDDYRFTSSRSNSTLLSHSLSTPNSAAVTTTKLSEEDQHVTRKRYYNTFQFQNLEPQQQMITNSIIDPSSWKLSHPLSTGHIHVPGMSASFQRTAQSVIQRASFFSTKSYLYHSHFNMSPYNIRTLSSVAPSPKKENDDDNNNDISEKKKEINQTGEGRNTMDSTTNHVSSNESSIASNLKKSATTSSSSSSSKKSPFITSAVVDTNDSWTVTKIIDKTQAFLYSSCKTIASLILKLPGVMFFYLTHPKEFKSKLTELADAAKKEAHHYWMGSKVCTNIK